MIAVESTLGLPTRPVVHPPVSNEQAWLTWAITDFNYQVEAFKTGFMIAGTGEQAASPSPAPAEQVEQTTINPDAITTE